MLEQLVVLFNDSKIFYSLLIVHIYTQCKMSFVFNQTMKQDQTQRTFEECLTILPTPGTEMQPCELHAQE